MANIDKLSGPTGPRVATTTAERPQPESDVPTESRRCVHLFKGCCNLIRIAQDAPTNPHFSEPTRNDAAANLAFRHLYAVAPAPSSRCLVNGDITKCGKGLLPVTPIQVSKKTW